MARFDLYVKQACDGGDSGSCPFCMRVIMYMLTKMDRKEIKIVPIDLANKTDEFLSLNPTGTTPVLVDHGADDKVIGDSGLIIEYIETLFPMPDMRISFKGAAFEASRSLFGAFAGCMKNKDMEKSNEHRQSLMKELQKLEDYLTNEGKDKTYLIENKLCEIDCSVYPKLLQIKVAGQELKGITIANDFPAIQSYMTKVESTNECQSCTPKNEDLVDGWLQHGAIKEC